MPGSVLGAGDVSEQNKSGLCDSNTSFLEETYWVRDYTVQFSTQLCPTL